MAAKSLNIGGEVGWKPLSFPVHTSTAFADTLVRFGDCAHTAARMTAEIRDEAESARRLTSIIRVLSRFFWFTATASAPTAAAC